MSDLDEALNTTFQEELDRSRFLAAVMRMCALYRQRNEVELWPNDVLAVERAYMLLERGARLPPRWRVLAA